MLNIYENFRHFLHFLLSLPAHYFFFYARVFLFFSLLLYIRLTILTRLVKTLQRREYLSVPVRHSIRTDGSFVTKNGVITEEGRESMSFGRIFLSTWIGEQFSQNFQKTARVTLCTPFHSSSYDYLLANATPEIVTNRAGVPKFRDDEIMFVEHNGELLLLFFFFFF